MHRKWSVPLYASRGDLEKMEYRVALKKMLKLLNIDDHLHRENRGSNAPKQDALIHFKEDFLGAMTPLFDVISLTIIDKKG